MKLFYEYLKNELEKFKGVCDPYVLYVPDLFRLLCDMMDQDIDREDRCWINSALAYFVLPNDFIPEHLYGPQGFADDIFVCVAAIKKLIEKHGSEVLKKHWHREDDFLVTIDLCYEKSRDVIEGKGMVQELLKYVGLG